MLVFLTDKRIENLNGQRMKWTWRMKMENEKPILRGELALIVAIVINSFSVVLMLYSGSGISAISSVPYAFSEVFTKLSLGTWTYLFQGALVLSLMILRKKFVPSYLFSFVAAFTMGKMVAITGNWIDQRVTFVSVLSKQQI